MPQSRTQELPDYKVFKLDGSGHGSVHTGTAEELIEWIRADVATRSEKTAKLSTRAYATQIIESAPHFLNPRFFDYLRREKFATEFDRALRYFSEMESAGIRILAANPGRHAPEKKTSVNRPARQKATA